MNGTEDVYDREDLSAEGNEYGDEERDRGV